ncbi:Zinc finger, C2H2 type family protein [Histomonas meleagridis]|uniref:zinc finger protein, C2H2 type family protein n=1 Tax=Histomonas meleagridis TaxID=135588 RepID=UPI00355A86DF|nr:Zinc finger, C2H2 type family protein [Histomonas meleagridis]KAH0803110.1 zinc finger protein, C2H2 type family protein [Histomonas meleagridis]
MGDYLKWTVNDVVEQIEAIGLGEHSQALMGNDISGAVLPLLNESHLKEMGISRVGSRLRFLKFIKETIEGKPTISQPKSEYSSSNISFSSTRSSITETPTTRETKPKEEAPPPRDTQSSSWEQKRRQMMMKKMQSKQEKDLSVTKKPQKVVYEEPNPPPKKKTIPNPPSDDDDDGYTPPPPPKRRQTASRPPPSKPQPPSDDDDDGYTPPPPPKRRQTASRQPPPSSFDNNDDEDDGERRACAYCGRKFGLDRIDKHEEICARSSSKKRKVFNAAKQRLADIGGERIIPKKSAPEPKKTINGVAKYKLEHERLIESLRAARKLQNYEDAKAKGKNVGPPPEVPKYEIIDDDRVPCPYCGRKFAEEAARRHIPVCERMNAGRRRGGRR